MKRADVPGNGNNLTLQESFTTQSIEENPYLQRTSEQAGQSDAQDENFDEVISDEDGAPIEPEDERRKVKQRRRRIALVVLATLFLIALVFAIAFYRRSPTRVDYGRASARSEVLPPAPTNNSTGTSDSRTEKAIEEAQRLTTKQTASDNRGNTSAFTSPEANSKTVVETPFKFPADSSGPINTSPTTAEELGSSERKLQSSTSTSSPDKEVSGIRSQRSSETSLYMGEQPVNLTISPTTESKKVAKTITPVNVEKPAPIVLPAFASMLPVRTVGALYTLRTGALVRLELTRDTSGDGWSMKRGTILIGSTKGGDLDRAYVSLIGFIDPQSGKLVKLEGDLLGGDGAAGLKGKRRQIDSGWAKAFGGLVSSALDITGALLSGHDRDTIVISDGLRTRTVNPVTDEISGVLGSELDRRQGKSFVEVVAGTSGYVLVTDLPSVIDGKEATPEVNGEHLASLTDVNTMRPSTGLSERELADLLASGSPDQIRTAMPRMSPEMRKIAGAVLRPR